MTKLEETVIMLLENQRDMMDAMKKLGNLTELLSLEIVKIKNNLEIERLMK